MDPIVTICLDKIREVFENKGLEAPELSADTALDASLGLDSLDYAELVVRMEDAMGFDPFAQDVTGEIRTVADFAALYQRAAS